MERGEVGARRRGRPAGELVRGVRDEGHGVEEALEGPGDGWDPAPRGLRGGAGAGAAGGGGLCGCGLGGCHCIIWRWGVCVCCGRGWFCLFASLVSERACFDWRE